MQRAPTANRKQTVDLSRSQDEAMQSVEKEIARNPSEQAQGSVCRGVRLGRGTSGDIARAAHSNYREELGLQPNRDDGLWHDNAHPREPEGPPERLRATSLYLGRWQGALWAMADHLGVGRGPLLRVLIDELLQQSPDEVARWIVEAKRGSA